MPIFILPVVFLSRFTLLRPILIQDSVRRGGASGRLDVFRPDLMPVLIL